MIKKLFDELKNNKKKRICVIILMLFVVVLILFAILWFNGIVGNYISEDEKRFKSEYESLNDVINEDDELAYLKIKLPKKNNIKYSNISEIVDIFNSDGDAVIYFGYPSCTYCRSAVQVLCNTVKKTKLKTIYYLDVEENNDRYKELIDIMGNKFTVDDKGVELYTPLVVFVANGDIVSHNKGTLFSQKTPYIKLDKSQVKGLSEIYEYGVKDVLRSIEIKNSVK